MKKYKIGVIGGSGIYSLKKDVIFEQNYTGVAQGTEKYEFDTCEIYFLARHGVGHSILPSEIDYVRNIKVFSNIEVDFVVSFCTVGSLNSKFYPGLYIIPKNLIDMTHCRKGSSYVMVNKHVNIEPIFNKDLVGLFIGLFSNNDIPAVNDGVLTVIEGPRFATEAEQRWYKLIGGDLLNMTQAQEIYLSHVFRIPFISLCHVTDLTSIVDKNHNIFSSDALKIFNSNFDKITKLLHSLTIYLKKHNINISYDNNKRTFV